MENPILTELYDDNTSLFLGLDEVKDILGIARGTVYSLAKNGDLPGCRKIVSKWLVYKKSLRDWLEGKC